MKTQIVAPVMTRKKAQQQLGELTDYHSIDQTCDRQNHERDIDTPVDHSCVLQPNQVHKLVVNDDSNKILPFTWEQLKKLQIQDEEINNIIRNIENHKEYFIEHNMLMKKASPPVPVVPK